MSIEQQFKAAKRRTGYTLFARWGTGEWRLWELVSGMPRLLTR